MEHLNQVTLCGVVGSVRHSVIAPDYTYINYSLATERMYKDSEKNIISETVWHQVLTIVKGDCELIKGIQKGCGVYVEGYIRYQKYTDANGIDKVFCQIVAEATKLIPESRK